MFTWIKKHWKSLASVGCTVVAVGAVPINPLLSAAIGGVCSVVLAKYESKPPLKAV